MALSRTRRFVIAGLSMAVTVALMVWAHRVLDGEAFGAFVIGAAVVFTGWEVWLHSTQRM